MCEEVAKYREGNYTPVKEEEEDKNQGNLFKGEEADIDEELEIAKM